MDMDAILAAYRVQAERRLEQAQSETSQKQYMHQAQPLESASSPTKDSESKKTTVPKIVLRFNQPQSKKKGEMPLSPKSTNIPATYHHPPTGEGKSNSGLSTKTDPTYYKLNRLSQTADSLPTTKALTVFPSTKYSGSFMGGIANLPNTASKTSTSPKPGKSVGPMGANLSHGTINAKIHGLEPAAQTSRAAEGIADPDTHTRIPNPESGQGEMQSTVSNRRFSKSGGVENTNVNKFSFTFRADSDLSMDETQAAKQSDELYSDMLKLLPGIGKATDNSQHDDKLEQLKVAPLFTREVETILPTTTNDTRHESVYAQYGLLGLRECAVASSVAGRAISDDLVFANMNSPWSAFICGSQGAGKSHTLSCLLENALLPDNRLGKLPNPLAGIVFHYDKFSSETTSQVCEAAYICSNGVPVTVLVSPSNIWAMKRMYANMSGLDKDAPKPNVLPLYLTEKQLNISRILKLMAMESSSKEKPLYLEVVTTILREMAMSGNPGGFSYSDFRSKLQEQAWLQGQSQALAMRISLLESFIAPSESTASTRPAASSEDIWAFPPGSLTIVDLSDPFVGEQDACAIFSICLSIFLEARATCGRVVALDEAHKTGDAQVLTESLTSIIREQRHTGTRVFIATQEPTLSPKLIDLANVTIVHRFLSPAWYHILRHHLAGAKNQDESGNEDLFSTIVGLQTGQALLFCPTAVVEVEQRGDGNNHVKPLGSGCLKIRIRSRLTTDGGKSIVASDKVVIGRRTVGDEIKMHVVIKPPPPLFAKQSTYQQKSQFNPPTSTAGKNETSNTNKPPPTDAMIRSAAREVMKDAFDRLRWHSIQSVPWDKIFAMLENHLGLKKDYLQKSIKKQLCIKAITEEMKSLRNKRGWSGE